MKTLYCTAAAVVLSLLPTLSQAQTGATTAVGLEIPAPAPPSQGNFLTGAYVLGNYTPALATAGGMGYSVQPYLRYMVGPKARTRGFIQYSFAPYRLQAYNADPLYTPGGVALPANPGFAPLPMRGMQSNSFGNGMGQFSVGMPVRLGGSPVMLHVAGNALTNLLR
ncbi:hypothetical protein [Hymenobacter arizonensis]|uniref:Uncharacterized protein n=1 Tax=Hymenobacter arizonensis TaxID=1227077 RepID=A0A1I6B753_HYMAR|nr:hypothetical protein [Hymenobacter arizonensis]SFQ76766.1 hypothetical protein SAMN04515668_4248 [Hymenobacter arizonensis]